MIDRRALAAFAMTNDERTKVRSQPKTDRLTDWLTDTPDSPKATKEKPDPALPAYPVDAPKKDRFEQVT